MSLLPPQLPVPVIKDASLRLLLEQLSASQRSHFAATYYPLVHSRFSDGMTETQRLNLWFELRPLPELDMPVMGWQVALVSLLLGEHPRLADYLLQLGAEDFEPSLRTFSYLSERARAALATMAQLDMRRAELEKLHTTSAQATLRVGLLGVTSSGKSALLNAVMGSAWLPEDPLPTTRVPVWCEYGSTEAARVHYVADDEADPPPPVELKAAALQAGELTALCDERAVRAADARAITGIELTSPTAEILRDADTVLIDTPGLDAEGHSQHHLIAMNEVLPKLDLVLYLKPVLAPFKAADLELLNAMVGHDQPVMMLLTKSDTVHDQIQSTPSGGLTLRKSAAQLITEAVAAAEAVLTQYPRLQRAGVLPVSAKLAKQARLPGLQPDSSGSLELKTRSGLGQLEKFLHALRDYKPALKAQRVGHLLVRLLGRIAEDLQDDNSEPQPSASAAPDNRELEIQALTVAHEQVAQRIQNTQQTWCGAVGKLQLFVKQITETLTALTASHVDVELEQLFRDAIAEVAALRADVQQQLENFGLSLSLGTDSDVPARQTEAPSNYRKFVKGEWTFENPFRDFVWRWRKASGALEKLVAPFGLRRYPDRTDMNTQHLIDDISSDIARLERYLTDKLAELTQRGQKQLQSQLDRERGARAQNLSTEQAVPGSNRQRAHQTIVQLQALTQQLVATTRHELPTVTLPPPPPPREFRIPATAPAALLGLLHSFAEQTLQRELLTVVGQLTRSARPKVLLLGSDRRPLLDLVARLLHRIELHDTLAGIPADHWLRLDNQSPPAPVPVGARTWDGRQLALPKGTILDRLTLVLAPADEHLPPLSADFIRRFDAVGIYLDAAQLGSGLADLRRAGKRYVDVLQSGAAPAFIINGQGSTLDHVLDELLWTIPAAVAQRFPRFTSWLVYSGYDARYSRFLALGQQALAEDQELVKLWEQQQLSFAAPFTPERLRHVIDHTKSRRTAAAPARRV